MKELEKPRAEEITRLHNEIVGHLRQSLDKAIRIGELLAEQKASLQHGKWGKWIEGNLPFTDRTARNYMRVYRERDLLKTESVSDLQSAYKLLAYGDIEARCCFGKYVDKERWGLDYCIDYCHGQCKAFNRGMNLPSGGLCGHRDAAQYGEPPPDEWCTAYKKAKERLGEDEPLEFEDQPEWCPYRYVWTATMSVCPREKARSSIRQQLREAQGIV